MNQAMNLHKYWFIIDWTLGNKQWNINQNTQSFLEENAFQIAGYKIAIFFKPRWLDNRTFHTYTWDAPSLTHCGLVTKQIWVNIGSGNGLLPDGTKPLPEPMLTYNHKSSVTFISGQFRNIYFSHQ